MCPAPAPAQLVDQWLQALGGLTSDEAAQHRVRPQLSRHARDPHSLARRVEVEVVALAPPLDRDREQRVGAEHRDRGGHRRMLAANSRYGMKMPCAAKLWLPSAVAAKPSGPPSFTRI